MWIPGLIGKQIPEEYVRRNYILIQYLSVNLIYNKVY